MEEFSDGDPLADFAPVVRNRHGHRAGGARRASGRARARPVPRLLERRAGRGHGRPAAHPLRDGRALVVAQGEPGDSLFLVTTGAVKAWIRNRDGRYVLVRRLGEGDFFGEISVLTGSPRTATVVAAAPCELLELDRATLDGITATHPRVREVLQRFYEQRIATSADAPAPSGGTRPERPAGHGEDPADKPKPPAAAPAPQRRRLRHDLRTPDQPDHRLQRDAGRGRGGGRAVEDVGRPQADQRGRAQPSALVDRVPDELAAPATPASPDIPLAAPLPAPAPAKAARPPPRSARPAPRPRCRTTTTPWLRPPWPSAPPSPRRRPARARLLVVDDNELNRDMLSRRLQVARLRGHDRGRRAAGLDLVKAQRFDLILLDIMMPGMSGIDVLQDHPQPLLGGRAAHHHGHGQGPGRRTSWRR